MKKLSTDEFIQHIEKEEVFEAIHKDGSFKLKIEDYAPYVCAAIHNGHQFRKELKKLTILSEYERWYEEDPHTTDFISSFPIVLEGCDSRFEYDLNRSPENAVYETAWGKQCWKKPLSSKQKNTSLRKHAEFYRVVNALVQKIEEKHEACIVFDIHSYNYKRWDRPVPVFNVGTENIDKRKYKSVTQIWLNELAKIELPDIENTTQENDVFFGRGYFLNYITSHFHKTLVLATEVSKIYCDELAGTSYPSIINAIKEGFKTAIINTVLEFTQKKTNLVIKNKVNLLSSEIDADLLKVDKQLYHLTKDFELLSIINPVNLEAEKKKFFKSKYKNNPDFVYQQLQVNPFEFKRQLASIQVEKIKDISIQSMYVDTINAFMDKVDLISNLGSEKFLYNSLRYFGEPSKRDIDNAQFLMYCPEFRDAKDQEIYTVKEAERLFLKASEYYGFKFKVVTNPHIVSKALVLNSKKTVVLKKGAKFSKRGIDGLVEHEIGVHMTTTMNALMQPLKIFTIGLPVNTMTQEGFAVLSEYLSDNMNLTRLRELAIRVLGIRSMVEGNDFATTFAKLVEEYGMKPDDAYYLNTRIYRGGGFTKDYLYLKGLSTILYYLNNKISLKNMLIGKTSIEYRDVIYEMVERGMLTPTHYYTKAFAEYDETRKLNPVLQYILSGLK